ACGSSRPFAPAPGKRPETRPPPRGHRAAPAGTPQAPLPRAARPALRTPPRRASRQIAPATAHRSSLPRPLREHGCAAEQVAGIRRTSEPPLLIVTNRRKSGTAIFEVGPARHIRSPEIFAGLFCFLPTKSG